MLEYRFDLSAYAQTRQISDSFFRDILALCREPIGQLCSRYDIFGKKILSLGAGDAFEESWMTPANTLTMVDINDLILSYKESLQGTSDRYLVGDAAAYVETCAEQFDILYVSSFAPDELRREELQAKFMERRSQVDAYNYITWPSGEDPYHPIIERALSLVKPNGLAIFQHYRGGIDVNFNPHYFVDVNRQFGRHGFQILEGFHFRESPPNLLLIAAKCDEHALRKLQKALVSKPMITSFHGRYGAYGTNLNKDIVQINPALFKAGELPRWKKILRMLARRTIGS